jgi:hypothetical protein
MERLKMQKSVGLHAPLNEGDTETETIGCRRDQPGFCMKNSLESVCAFARADNVCKAPPTSWPKQFLKLKTVVKSGV